MDHAASGGQTDKAEGAPSLVQKMQMIKTALADSQRLKSKGKSGDTAEAKGSIA
jgi:hypothetical protein